MIFFWSLVLGGKKVSESSKFQFFFSPHKKNGKFLRILPHHLKLGTGMMKWWSLVWRFWGKQLSHVVCCEMSPKMIRHHETWRFQRTVWNGTWVCWSNSKKSEELPEVVGQVTDPYIKNSNRWCFMFHVDFEIKRFWGSSDKHEEW